MVGKKVNRWKLLNARYRIAKRDNDDDLKCAGIYAIVNRRNGNIYIGQSTDLLRRKKEHFNALKQKYHFNQHLQNAYNYYGVTWFEFVVIEKCFPWDMDEREQYYIDELKPEYNIVMIVEDISCKRTDLPQPMCQKPGESFARPEWHRFVYGGERKHI